MPKRMKKVMKTGKISKAVKSYVHKSLDLKIEDKINYLNFGANPIFNTGAFRLLTGLTKGTNVDDRLGNRIRLKKLQMGFNMGNGNPALVGNQWVRVIIFKDKQTNGLTPALNNFMPPASVGNYVSCPLDPNYVNRFHIFKDVKYPVGSENNHSDDKEVRIRIPLKGIVQYNDANSGTVTDIISGALYVLLVSNFGATPPILADTYAIFYEDA